jgi:protein-tyrosine-phosphatase
MGREAAKKKGKKKSKEVASEVVDKEWAEYKQFNEKELERLDKIALMQQEANQLMKEKTQTKKMKLYLKLSSNEHLDDRKKELWENLAQELFDN